MNQGNGDIDKTACNRLYFKAIATYMPFFVICVTKIYIFLYA